MRDAQCASGGVQGMRSVLSRLCREPLAPQVSLPGCWKREAGDHLVSEGVCGQLSLLFGYGASNMSCGYGAALAAVVAAGIPGSESDCLSLVQAQAVSWAQ